MYLSKHLLDIVIVPTTAASPSNSSHIFTIPCVKSLLLVSLLSMHVHMGATLARVLTVRAGGLWSTYERLVWAQLVYGEQFLGVL